MIAGGSESVGACDDGPTCVSEWAMIGVSAGLELVARASPDHRTLGRSIVAWQMNLVILESNSVI